MKPVPLRIEYLITNSCLLRIIVSFIKVFNVGSIMESPTVSVIVPVYNVEKFIHKCVNSILAQSFTDIELILVDDGSQDGSGPICDGYALKDTRVRVIHKHNEGVSSARNTGINEAKGEWICFVDGDDWIDKDYLSAFFIGGEDSDLLVQGYKEFSLDGLLLSVHRFSTDDRMPFASVIIESERLNIINSPCFKLFKTSIIRQNNIKFDTRLSYGEDHIFTYEYLNRISTIKQGFNTGYNVNRGIDGSLSTKRIPFEKIVLFMEMLYSLQLPLLSKYPESRQDLLCAINERRYSSIRKIISDSKVSGLNKHELFKVKQLISESIAFNIQTIGVKHYIMISIIEYLPYSLLKLII